MLDTSFAVPNTDSNVYFVVDDVIIGKGRITSRYQGAIRVDADDERAVDFLKSDFSAVDTLGGKAFNMVFDQITGEPVMGKSFADEPEDRYSRYGRAFRVIGARAFDLGLIERVWAWEVYDPTKPSIDQKLIPIIAKHVKVEEPKITFMANFIDDLGADDLDVVELIMEVEDEFGIVVSDEVEQSLTSVGALAAYLRDNVVGGYLSLDFAKGNPEIF